MKPMSERAVTQARAASPTEGEAAVLTAPVEAAAEPKAKPTPAETTELATSMGYRMVMACSTEELEDPGPEPVTTGLAPGTSRD